MYYFNHTNDYLFNVNHARGKFQQNIQPSFWDMKVQKAEHENFSLCEHPLVIELVASGVN